MSILSDRLFGNSGARLQAVARIAPILTEAIRAAGEIPSGTLYALALPHLPMFDELAVYEASLRAAIGAKLVARRGDLLCWCGPSISDLRWTGPSTGGTQS